MIAEECSNESTCRVYGAGQAQAVIIDTDIGTDVDDAYAILLAICSPELKVRGITVVHGDVSLRAKIARKLLMLAGRVDLPIVLGERSPISIERPIVRMGHEGRGIDFSDELDSTFNSNAPEFIARSAAERPGELVLIAIGSLTNLATAIRDFPRETMLLRGVVAMGSAFNGFGRECAGTEHNVALDPEAAEIVLVSGIPMLLVGLNVTKRTALTGRHLADIASARTPLAELMAQMTRDWLDITNRESTPMHDPLAVAASFDPKVVTSVPVTAEVNTKVAGSVAYFEAGSESSIWICTSVDIGRFEDLFFSRITRAVGEPESCH